MGYINRNVFMTLVNILRLAFFVFHRRVFMGGGYPFLDDIFDVKKSDAGVKYKNSLIKLAMMNEKR